MMLSKNLCWMFLCGLILFTLCLSESCTVKHPRYTTPDAVDSIHIGMTFEAVEDSLGIPYYYIRNKDSTGYTVYAFKYRLKEIRRIPIVMNRNNGFEREGDFVDLFVLVDPNGIVKEISTCTNCTEKEIKTTVVSFDGLIRGITTVITVTLPALIILFGSNN